MSVRVEAIGALFSAGIAAYLVYMASASASNTGFALNMAGTWYSVTFHYFLTDPLCSWLVRMDPVLDLSGQSIGSASQQFGTYSAVSRD